MAEYRVEYWTSSDGTAIANGRAGSGYPVLHVPAIVAGIESHPCDTMPQGFDEPIALYAVTG